MAQEARSITSDQTIQQLQEKATKDGDEFTVKVLRRPHLSMPAQLMASLEGANLAHFTSPELWVPDLCGGGKYMLQCFHASDGTKQIGGYVSFSVDQTEPRDVNIDAVKAPGWHGPAILQYPKKEQPRQAASEFSLYDVRSPPGPNSGDSANKQPAWVGQPGGGVHRANYGEDPNSFASQARALESERRALEKERLDNANEKHRSEIETLKKSHDSELRGLEARLEAKIATARPAGPDPMLEFMKMQAEDRRAQQGRDAEDRRADRERQDKADARFMMLFEKLSDRKERDPFETVAKVAELIKPKNDDSVLMKTMHNMVEMQGTMMGAAMDFVDTASRLQLGGGADDNEPGWMKGIDKVVKGIGAMAKAQTGRPPAPMPQVPQQQMQGIPAGGVAQPIPQHPGAAPGSYATQPAPPAQPTPGAPPAAPVPNGLQQELTIIEQLEVAIRNHHNIQEIAQALLTRLNDPSIEAALAESGGDFERVVNKRLGEWAKESPSNAAYLKNLFKEVERQLEAAGRFEDDAKTDEPDAEADADVDPDDDEDDTEEDGEEGAGEDENE